VDGSWDYRNNMSVTGNVVGTGTLITHITPSSATLKVGAGTVGNNETIIMTPGTFNYEVYASGYITKTGTVTIEKDKTTTLTVNLSVSGGNLYTNFNPTDITVRIDGTMSVYNDGLYSLSVGSHSWYATKSGYTSKSGNFTIYAGDTKNLNITLTAEAGPKLTVQAYSTHITFSVTGFPANETVHMRISDPVKTSELYTDSSGSGSGAMVNLVPNGAYWTLYGEDDEGNVAYATFILS
jgi:hypothetical protein